jgi:polyhydroxyalkanoate synthesis repressor PhaR
MFERRGYPMDSVMIKKYSNRRLYNTVISEYITLEDVSALVKEGKKITVQDAKSGDDVTSYVLTQIVLEESKNNNGLLPDSLLHLLIRYGDNVLNDFFSKHLQQTMSSYITQKSSFDDQFKQMLELGNDFSDMAKKSMGDMNPFSSFMDMFSQSNEDNKEKDNK